MRLSQFFLKISKANMFLKDVCFVFCFFDFFGGKMLSN